MDNRLISLSDIAGLVPDPSVLIVESHPNLESIPRRLRAAMPEVVFDMCASPEEGLSKLDSGHYHAVLSDARSAEARGYSLLRRAQMLSCPVPVVLSDGTGDSQALGDALTHGALDVIRWSASTSEASSVIKRALWLFRVRLTIFNRRQRLRQYRCRSEQLAETMSDQRRQIVERAIQDIEDTNRVCERTMEQIESSLRVLEDLSHRSESDIRDCAMRMVRLTVG
jgi:DNA-binding NtrC family response regulator